MNNYDRAVESLHVLYIDHSTDLKAVRKVIRERPAFETAAQADQFFILMEAGITEMIDPLETTDE